MTIFNDFVVVVVVVLNLRHPIDLVEERVVERGVVSRSVNKWIERAAISQTNTAAVTRATLGTRPIDGAQCIWDFTTR